MRVNLADLAVRLERVEWDGEKRLKAKCPGHSDEAQSLTVRAMGPRLTLRCEADCTSRDILEAIGLDLSDLVVAKDAGVAQRLEQPARNGKAAGSNPATGSEPSSEPPKEAPKSRPAASERQTRPTPAEPPATRQREPEPHGDHILKRTPPQNLEAEQSVLGAVFIENDMLPPLREIIETSDFYRETHRMIFDAMCTLADDDTPIDALTVTETLKRRSQLEMIGGAAYIAELAAAVPATANAPHYARMVRDASIKRHLASTLTQLAAVAYNGVAANELVARVSRELAPVLTGTLSEDRSAIDAADAYDAMQSDNRGYVVDGLIREGCTAVLSGLMSSGKSTLAMNVARAWALGEPILEREAKQSNTLVVVSPKEYEAWADTIGFWQLRGRVFLAESTKAHFRDPMEQVRWFAATMERHQCRTFILDTLFDFYGMPPNVAGDSNRIAMNEQAPMLELIREKGWAGLLNGHAPKSEAKAIDPRDPEESFAGHTAWTAQHRMRMAVRRRSQNVNTIVTGKGGYGDTGLLKELVLLFDPETRLVTLGPPIGEYLGVAAMPAVIAALDGAGWMSRPEIEKATGKEKKWVLAGIREGKRRELIKVGGGGRKTRYALSSEPDEPELL
jgi:DnaB-like helicase N terminal domain/AAA domain